MATTPGPFTKTDAKGWQPERSIPVSLTLNQFVALLVVGLIASWLGFYIITPLPFLQLNVFNATIVLHAVTGAVLVPYLISLFIARRLPGGSPLDVAIVALLGAYLLATAGSLNWRVSLEVSLTVLMAVSIFYVLSDRHILRRWQVEWALMLAVLAAAVSTVWIVAGDYTDWLRLTESVRGSLSFGDLIPPTVPKAHDVGDHPNILGHRQEHLHVVLRLALGVAAELDAGQLSHPLDQVAYLRAKLLGDRLLGAGRVLDNVVQQTGAHSPHVHAQTRQCAGHVEAVRDVGIPREAHLALMGTVGHPIGLAHKFVVRIRIGATHLLEQFGEFRPHKTRSASLRCPCRRS